MAFEEMKRCSPEPRGQSLYPRDCLPKLYEHAFVDSQFGHIRAT